MFRKVFFELNIWVNIASYLMSYSHSVVQEAGITLADHHTTSEAFIQHMKKEVSDTTNNSFLFWAFYMPC